MGLISVDGFSCFVYTLTINSPKTSNFSSYRPHTSLFSHHEQTSSKFKAISWFRSSIHLGAQNQIMKMDSGPEGKFRNKATFKQKSTHSTKTSNTNPLKNIISNEHFIVRIADVKIPLDSHQRDENIAEEALKQIATKLKIQFHDLTLALYGTDPEEQDRLIRILDKGMKSGRYVKYLLEGLKQDNALLPSKHLDSVEIIRKSFDCRQKDPKISFVLDLKIPQNLAAHISKKIHTNDLERKKISILSNEKESITQTSNSDEDTMEKYDVDSQKPNIFPFGTQRKKVIVVGAGPAGYFAALRLASLKKEYSLDIVLFERGKSVAERGKDIGALQSSRRILLADSNFCHGEGGAGTWSDGKLTTSIGRNGADVRSVLSALVKFGAPDTILVSNKPHLGTDGLVLILRNMRHELEGLGAQIRFNSSVEEIIHEDGRCKGVKLRNGHIEYGDAVIFCTGHSSNDSYKIAWEAGVQIEPKNSAMGFRIEHPQKLINEIQYGEEFANSTINKFHKEYTSKNRDPTAFTVPVADYSISAENIYRMMKKEPPQVDNGVRITADYNTYSFCMCPGGQIVPTSVDESELCINGMSFSKRQSKWANSGLVCNVGLDEYTKFGEKGEENLAKAALRFRADIERRAAQMGGGNLVAPAQRVLDFIAGIETKPEDLPLCSYRPGIKSARLDLLYPKHMTEVFQNALVAFGQVRPGFLSPDALLVAPESRTSSVVRLVRDHKTKMAVGLEGFFPAGEGAGYAGGIVTAAVEGQEVADCCVRQWLVASKK